MASVDQINYAVRPNKSVERKLMFEALSALDPMFPLATYRYVGLGSLWFVDFVMAHRMLGIDKMISIQSGAELAARARFNAPYACITVEEGDTSEVLPEIDFERGPAVVWLDYESRIDRVLPELAKLCSRLASGTILIVTVNATKDKIDIKDEGERRRIQEEDFRRSVGDLAPAMFPADFFDASKYPSSVAETLLKHLSRATRIAGRDVLFETLFNFSYKDGTAMITVGGMIGNATDRQRLSLTGLQQRFPFVRTDGSQTTIAVPPLTFKEKLALDQMLPSDSAPSLDVLNNVGLWLKAAHVESYWRYYKRYPVFGEFVP